MRALIRIVAATALSVSLAGSLGTVAAQQDGTEIINDADGTSATSTSGVNPTASGEGSTIVYGDINTGGAGRTVIEPPTVIQGGPPPPVTAPAPEPEPAVDTTTEAPADTSGDGGAVATDSDLDADNYPDAAEPDLGLDPTNIDTDGDGVADGDELNIYGTDATVYDTDGDGVSDGGELFDSRTDPLVWDDFSSETTETAAEQAAASPARLAQGTTESLTATDGNATTLGTGSASASPGTVTRPGSSILGPDGAYSVSDTAPPVITVGATGEVAPAPAPEETATEAPVEEAPADTSADTTATETAAATDTDSDADNYPDAAEYDLGLDPYNPDTDGDGIADGDELIIYATDPANWDTDGDSVGDGEEIFGIQTDALVWDTDGDGISDGQS